MEGECRGSEFTPDYKWKESVGGHSLPLTISGRRVLGVTVYDYKWKESVGGHSLPLTIRGKRV